MMDHASFYANTDRINAALRGLAEKKGISGPAVKQFMDKAWSTGLRPDGDIVPGIALYGIINEALTGTGTPYDKAMLHGLERFIQNYRVYLAQDALNAYDAWDRSNLERKRRARTMMSIADYGTVPPDFSAIAQTAVLAAGIAGAAKATTFAYSIALMTPVKVGATAGKAGWLSVAASSATSAGALAVAAPFAILAGAALHQFIAIAEARPKLEKQLKEAQAPVSIKAMLKTPEGIKEVQAYWALVMAQKFQDIPAYVQQALQSSYQQAHLQYQGINTGPQLSAADQKRNEEIKQSMADMAKSKADRLKAGTPLPKPISYNRTTKSGGGGGGLVITMEGPAQQALTYEEYDAVKDDPEVTLLDPPPPRPGSPEWKLVQETPPAMRQNWQKISGSANDIAVGDDGRVWLIGAVARGNAPIWVMEKGAREWTKFSGLGTRISAGDTAWVINSAGNIFRLDPRSQKWRLVPGPKAVDIGVGTKDVWMVGGQAKGKDYQIFKREGNQWVFKGGYGTRVDVDANGNAIIVNSLGDAWFLWQGEWIKVDKRVSDIGVGPVGGIAYAGANNDKVKRKDAKTGNWRTTQAQGQAIAVGLDNKIWLVGPKKGIFKEK